jgi:nucleoside-diphosphate-sugar epimerase
MQAIAHRSQSVGEAFHVVSPAAITLRGYAERVAAWFGQAPRLEFWPWPEWKAAQGEVDATATLDHISRSPNASIAKAERLIGYQPRYSSLEGVFDALRWLIANGVVLTGQPALPWQAARP